MWTAGAHGVGRNDGRRGLERKVQIRLGKTEGHVSRVHLLQQQEGEAVEGKGLEQKEDGS